MQSEWRWCKKCQGLAFWLNEPGVCPAGGSHDHTDSGNYALALDDPSAKGQADWRWCKKCQGLAFSLNQPSVCPAGGNHDHRQSGNYTLPHDDPSVQGQSDWRWCNKCQGLTFSLNQPSVCPAGGSHDLSKSGNYTLAYKQGASTQPGVDSVFVVTSTTPPPHQRLRVPDLTRLLPSGASLIYMDGDIGLSHDFLAGGKTVRFYWNVSKVPNARGALWQVSQVPFAPFRLGEDPKTLKLSVSGKGSGAAGSFLVEFAKIPRPVSIGRSTYDPPWYVRVIPQGSSGNVVGQPSNIIRVYDRKMPPADQPDIRIESDPWYVRPGVPVRLTRFESVPYRYKWDWPPGCKEYHGDHKHGLDWVTGAVTDAFEWTSEAYQDAQNFVVTGVVTIFPFVPRKVAEIALQAALASAGIPPSIPNLNGMLTNGADYLAGQMADELAAQVPAGSELAQLGKEELRKKIQEDARRAIVETAKNIREPGADSEYCVGKEYRPILKITVQNAGAETCTDVEIELSMSFDAAALGYTDFSVPNQPGLPSYLLLPLHGPLLRPFEPFNIDRIDPGQSLTIPVDIFSHWNIDALPEDRSSVSTTRNIGHWKGFYKYGQFSFTLDGGRTLQYQTRKKDGPNGPRFNESFKDDGMGFSFKSPKRAWMDEPFVWSPG